jgi:hypothetical protein
LGGLGAWARHNDEQAEQLSEEPLSPEPSPEPSTRACGEGMIAMEYLGGWGWWMRAGMRGCRKRERERLPVAPFVLMKEILRRCTGWPVPPVRHPFSHQSSQRVSGGRAWGETASPAAFLSDSSAISRHVLSCPFAGTASPGLIVRYAAVAIIAIHRHPSPGALRRLCSRGRPIHHLPFTIHHSPRALLGRSRAVPALLSASERYCRSPYAANIIPTSALYALNLLFRLPSIRTSGFTTPNSSPATASPQLSHLRQTLLLTGMGLANIGAAQMDGCPALAYASQSGTTICH